ncbi:MAG: arsenate reductase ArsC [Rhodospirillaceae bacterium]
MIERATRLPDAVLFACTFNCVRSPMAEGMLKHLMGHRIYVDSVGVVPKEINGFMIEVMGEIGIDMSNHKSKGFDELLDSSYDLIISLSPKAQHSAIELTRWMACDVEYWPTMDPSIITGSREVKLDGFRRLRNELMEKIRTRFSPQTAVFPEKT